MRKLQHRRHGLRSSVRNDTIDTDPNELYPEAQGTVVPATLSATAGSPLELRIHPPITDQHRLLDAIKQN